jgi:uncharacterized protein YdaU (DUF1376 family)
MATKVDIWMPLYVADYLSATSRLTTEQHGAYLLLLMDYWKNGPPPDNDGVLAQITKLSPDAWSNARTMLQGFFQQHSGQWLHGRVEQELAKANHNKEVNFRRAKAGADARYGKKDAPTMLEASLMHSSSPSPSPSEFKNKAPKVATPDGVSDSVWQDFQKLRKAKKAAITATAMLGIKREADKARVSLQQALETCCERGWVGFKAEWLEQKSFAAPLTVPSRQGVDPALAKAIADQIAGKPPSAEIRAKMAAIRGAT